VWLIEIATHPMSGMFEGRCRFAIAWHNADSPTEDKPPAPSFRKIVMWRGTSGRKELRQRAAQ